MEPLERHIETKFGEMISRWADAEDINLAYVKFDSAKGWPDRIVTWGKWTTGPHLIWIEWKRPGETPRPLQLHIHKILRSMGHDVRVYDDYNVAMAEITEDIRASLRADKRHEAHRAERGMSAVSAPRQGEDQHSPKGVQRPKKT